MKEQLRLSIKGRVQGVFFRAEGCQKAQELDLAGWIRNTGEGHVEVLAQGECAALERFLAWCRHGPPRAKVDFVEVAWEKPTEEYAGFRVVR